MQKFKKVLLIDDNTIDIYVNKYMLEKAHVAESIVSFTSGSDAMEYLSSCPSNSSDLILLDIQMPIMNGFEFLKKFESEIKPSSPPKIIMLSSSQNEKDYGTLIKNNLVSGYIIKPLSLEKIVKHI